MKKITILLFTILTLTLSACGGASRSMGINRNSTSQNGSTTGELPATTRLLIGTLKLEGTGQVVTAKQAVDLLPLWQTMKVLSESDTAAQQEKEALIAQIQETMTPGQIQAITNMKLTRADLVALQQEQGTANNSTGNQNSSSQNRSSSSNSSRRNFGQGGGGFFPGAGGPPEGGFGGQGQNLTPAQIATAQASRQQRSGNFIPAALINAVIEYLQKKAGG